MSLQVHAYRVVVPGKAPIGAPMEQSKIYGKGHLEAAKQWGRDRAAERGHGAEIHIHPGIFLIWQLRAIDGKECSLGEREPENQIRQREW